MKMKKIGPKGVGGAHPKLDPPLVIIYLSLSLTQTVAPLCDQP